MYRRGLGVPKDYKKAVIWYRKAADAGDTNAMYSLGYAYKFGQGVPTDLQKSKEWYQKAEQNE